MQLRRPDTHPFLITAALLLSGFRACAPDVQLGDDDGDAGLGAPNDAGPARGLGERCRPLHDITLWSRETYTEDPGAECGELSCTAYGLDGDLGNLRSEGCPAGEESCIDDVSAPGASLPASHAARVFCSCRCAPDPLAPDVPPCDCGADMVCSEVGVCVPPAALERDLVSGNACVPRHVPEGGFDPAETYAETDHPDCGPGRACIVSHLDGDPRNLASEGCPGGADSCVDDSASPGSSAPLTANDLRRVACGCRCAPDPLAPDAPTCPCVNGLVCSDAGFCALPEAAHAP